MATGPRPSFQKRQKELARLQKQQEKQAKRVARKKEREAVAQGLLAPPEVVSEEVAPEGEPAGDGE
jgi:hypothetical protein